MIDHHNKLHPTILLMSIYRKLRSSIRRPVQGFPQFFKHVRELLSPFASHQAHVLKEGNIIPEKYDPNHQEPEDDVDCVATRVNSLIE